jgi:hypothetical protein
MGKTWKYKTMFDLDMEEDSFADILYNAGIDVISVDWQTGDTHQTIFKKCRDLVNIQNPDYIMGYCYGCAVASAIGNNKTKHMFMLDPCPDKSKQTEFIPEFATLMNDDIKNRNLNLDEKLPQIALDKIKCPVTIFNTSDSSEMDKQNSLQVKFIKNKTVVDLQGSHYVLIEPARYELANKIMEIMNV